jgi:tRNA A-37 threonylcarbamoyl transferase component Bud32
MSSLVRVVEPPHTWWVPRPELDAARRILPLIRDLTSGQSRFPPIKDTAHKSVYRLPGLSANTAIYVKIYRRNSWRYLLRQPPGTREARAMIKLRQAGVPVGDLVAVGIQRRFLFGIENLLVVRSAGNLWTLGRWCLGEFREHGDKARQRVTPVLVRLLAAVRRMHDTGIFHGDLNPGNILIDPDGKEFMFIDFHRSRALWPGERRARVWDVCKTVAYFDRYYTPAELAELACAYAPGSGALSRAIRTMWTETTQMIRQRWTSHILDQCCESRTYFRHVTLDTATLHMDRTYDPDAIRQSVSGRADAAEWRHEALPSAQEEARECWRLAVRTSMRGETDETPVALVLRPPAEGGNLLLWDTHSRPKYLLSYMFSLERFDPAGESFLTKTRGN